MEVPLILTTLFVLLFYFLKKPEQGEKSTASLHYKEVKVNNSALSAQNVTHS